MKREPRPGGRELLAGGMVKGGMMAAHVTWATKDHSPEDVNRFWNAIPGDVAAVMRTLILPVKWYEFAHLIAVDRAIVEVYGGGEIAILSELGAQSARMSLTGMYKAYRRESIHDFLENNARLHTQFQDFGKAVYRRHGPSSGTMMLSEYRSFSPLYCESASGFYREALHIHGGREIAIRETSCQCRAAGSCTFELQWR
jgi:predicted hydrocarbon binding protein